jgi:peptide/nickel transport system substrate-binding protein
MKKKEGADAIRMAIPATPVSLDSRTATDSYGIMITRLIFDGLFKPSDNLETVPNLVDTYEQPDDKTYRFHLKKGVKFHNGAPLTAEDVEYTYRSIIDGKIKSAFRGGFDRIQDIKVEAPDVITITLKEPYAPIFTLLGIGIVPKGIGEAAGDSFGQSPIGSGPYKFVRYVPDSVLELEANPDYYGDKPKTKRLVFDIVKDDNVRVLKIIKGDVDIVQNAIPPMLIEKVVESPHVKMMEATGITMTYMGVNLTDPILSVGDVRKAIAYAIDRDAVISHRFQGRAVKANSILSPENWAYGTNLMQYEFDPAKAKDLLTKAGYPDPDGDGPGKRFGLIYKTSDNKERIEIAQMIAHQLEAVGIGVRVEPYEWGKFYGDIKNGNFQIYSLSWSLLTEPDMFYDICHSSQFAPNGVNRDRYSNPKVDGLVSEARVSMDREKRKALYDEVQKIVLEDLPYIPLWYEKNIVVYRDDLAGVRIRPDGDLHTLVGMEKK